AEEAAAAFQLNQIQIRHRLGFVPTGEPSLFVRVGSQHRAEAFRAGGWIVDELKKRVPIWKRPRQTSGAQLRGERPPAASKASS
ncbi:MAG: molybdenum cofactor biosynthesis protein MoaE, partial [Limisphaerales bacterium]